LTAAKWADRVADRVTGETVPAAGLFQRRGTGATIGDEGGLPALYAFHRDPRDGLIGRWPLSEVGARLDARESNLYYLEIVATWVAADISGRPLCGIRMREAQ
jgi:hypothetical protein